MSEGDFLYKSLPTIAKEFLPRAEKMHNEGVSSYVDSKTRTTVNKKG